MLLYNIYRLEDILKFHSPSAWLPAKAPTATIIVFALLVVSYFVSYFFRVSTSIMLPSLAVQWKLDPATVGVISSLYFYTYGLAQPLSGALNDRFGPTRIIPAALTLTGIGALMMGYATTPLVFAVGRAITGLGLAPMLSGVLSFQSAAFPAALYATLSGITFTVGNFGAVASVAPLDRAIDAWGRGPVFVFLSAGGLAVAAALFLNLKHDAVVKKNTESRRTNGSVMRNLSEAFKAVLGSRQLLRILVIWCVYFASLMAFQGLWAVSWYRAAFGISQAEASSWATLIGIGVMGGSLLGGYVWKPAARRRTAIRISYSVYVIAWVALWFSLYRASSLALTGILGFCTGFMGGVCSDHLTAGLNDLAEPGRSGSSFGAMNLVIYMTIIIYQSGSGFILSLFPVDASGRYDNHSFVITFGIVIAVLIVCLLSLVGLKSFAPSTGPARPA